MANQYEADVVRYFRKKGNSGFDEPITFLGAEQRYVNALRNSGINNLEEQYILGTDAYIEVITDENGNIIIEESFHVNSSDPNPTYTDYYKVKTTIYKEAFEHSDFHFNDDELVFSNAINKIIFGNGSVSYPDLNSLYGIDSNLFSFNQETFDIFSNDFVLTRKDELFFVTDNGATEKRVLTKTIYKKYVKVNDDQVKILFKEDIQNHLI